MANPNITRVYLLDTPLEGDYENTLYFDSKEAQREYMLSKVVHTFTDFSYQRKDGFIRVPMHIDKLYNCNYVMYQNTAYSNKWFYAFITDMVYISGNEDGTDGRTDIYIQTDVIQTWLFDYEVLPSFVEREHTASDEIGEHTYPEGLETGEYVYNTDQRDTTLDDLCLIVAATKPFYKVSDEDTPSITGALYNGIYSGVEYYAFDLPSPNYKEDTEPEEIEVLNEVIEQFHKNGIADSIQSIFILPKKLITLNNNADGDENVYNSIKTSYKAIEYDITNVSKYYKLDQHNVVRNNKLFCYPYRYLMVSNNNGSNAIYQYEHFKHPNSEYENNATFRVYGAITPGGSIRLVPLYYKGQTEADEEGLNLGKYPICSWASDVYTNWLTQNSVNIGVSVASGLATFAAGAAMIAGVAAAPATGGASLAVTGAAMAGGAMTAASGVAQVGSTIGQVYQQSFTPPQAKGNLNAGDVITATRKNSFHFYNVSIKSEYVDIIDNYFDMYGYKICKVKQPEVAKRTNWWYTKTINVNIDGAIPGKDMQIIKDCYNRGIRFWRSTARMGDYSQGNGITA